MHLWSEKVLSVYCETKFWLFGLYHLDSAGILKKGNLRRAIGISLSIWNLWWSSCPVASEFCSVLYKVSKHFHLCTWAGKVLLKWYSSPYFSQKELIWLKAWSKIHWSHWVLDHSLNVVKPAIKLKAQLSSSTTELLFLCPSKTLCPYCRVTGNVVVDISKVKESALKECRGLSSCFFVVFCCVFSNLIDFNSVVGCKSLYCVTRSQILFRKLLLSTEFSERWWSSWVCKV